VLAALLLAFPPAAGAKFTCEERGRPPEGFVLRGLPAKPVAGRAYSLSVVLRTPDAANPAPYLGAERCGRRPPAGAGGWFTPAHGHAYVLSLRFPSSGRWALSFMDLDGTFYDAGVHRVAARSTEPWFAVAVKHLLVAVQRP
jgi:hypothetical protein